jgi:integrase
MAGLTAWVDRAEPGRSKQPGKEGEAIRREIADDKCAGLYLVVQPGGTKSWALRFRSPTDKDKDGQRAAKKLTLGPLASGASKAAPEIGKPLTLSQARMLATAAMETVKQGIDPTATRREAKAVAKQEAVTDSSIDAAMIEFLKKYKGKKRTGIRDSTRLLTALYFGLKPDPEKSGEWKKTGRGVLGKWSGKTLASITKRDAITLLDGLVDDGHGVTANRTLTCLKTLFGYCVKNDLLATSPVAALDAVAEEHSRQRTLTNTEVVALWRAAGIDCDPRRLATVPGYPFGHLVQLLILTGARRDELRKATWSEFDLDARTWLLPASRSKNGREHLVPLSPMAVEILKKLPRFDSQLLFTTTGTTAISGLSKAKARFDKAIGADDWSPHDLRRTFYTGLQALGFSIEVAEACVNHKSGTLRGVAAVYARHGYFAEKTAAFEAWARHVDRLVNGTTGADVVPLHGARR